VLPVVGFEVERLSKLWVVYQNACEKAGLMQPDRMAVSDDVREPVDVQKLLNQQIDDLPPDLRKVFVDTLREARLRRERTAIAEVDTRVAAMLPSNTSGEQPTGGDRG